MMERVDQFQPEYRALVYEYGWDIVAAMIDQRDYGLNNVGNWPPPDDIAFDLEMWRWKRQEELRSLIENKKTKP